MENILYSKKDYEIQIHPVLQPLFPLTFPDISYTHKTIWMNPDSDSDFRITSTGIQAFIAADIKEHNLRYPVPIPITSRIILLSKKYILSPYFLYNNSISVFNERIAFELILFNNDIVQYLNSRSTSDKIN